jgi:hypothetical protein
VAPAAAGSSLLPGLVLLRGLALGFGSFLDGGVVKLDVLQDLLVDPLGTSQDAVDGGLADQVG